MDRIILVEVKPGAEVYKCNLSLKNYSYCLIDSKIILVPNSAVKIMSILYEILVSDKTEIKQNVNFVLDIDKVIPIGPRNYLAMQNGIEFLKSYKIENKRIFNHCSISDKKLSVLMNIEFLLKLVENIYLGKPLFKFDVKNNGRSAILPIEFNI